MKKLMFLIAACCLTFVACNNKPAETEEPTTDSTEVVAEQPACCPMMQEWADFDNKTAEEQEALITKRAECINHILAEVNIDEIECPKAKTELPAFIEKWNKEFATADLAAKKALIDEFDTFKCLKKQEGNCCQNKCKCCNDKCGKDCKCEDCKCCNDKCGKDCKCEGCDNKCGKDCKTECCKDKCEGEKCQHNCKK